MTKSSFYQASTSYVAINNGAAYVQSFNTRQGVVVPILGDYSASLISNTPAGGLASTTVQDALNELDAEKENAKNRNYVRVDLNGTVTAVGNAQYPYIVPFIKSGSLGVDVDGVWNNATHRYQPTVAGKYLVQMDTLWASVLPAGTAIGAGVFKKGIEMAFPVNASVNASASQNMVAIISMDGITDYLEFSVYQNGVASGQLSVVPTRTYASMIRIA